jgi:nucleoside-diphosphate-sugar epimerase
MARGHILVTGATGLIGHGLVQALSLRGDPVRSLVRSAERARRVLPEGVELAVGDVTEPATLGPALRGIDLVFHSAGMPEQWQRDDRIFDRVNRQGTKHVLEASLEAGVRRVVYTSTMDVFAAPPGGTLSEAKLDEHPKPTAYERSKQAAEREAEGVARRGLELVYVNPAAVYGPSLAATTTNGFIQRLLRHQVPLLPPGGMSLAFIDGVVQAHLAAAERGRPGERYLIADEHLSVRELATQVLAAAPGERRVPNDAPAWLLKLLAPPAAQIARLFGLQPLIAPGELAFLLWNARVDAGKARRELGFTPTPASEGLQRTVRALLANDSAAASDPN